MTGLTEVTRTASLAMVRADGGHGGELTAGELETLWPQRVPASPDTPAAAASAWDALRQDALRQPLRQHHKPYSDTGIKPCP